MSLDLRILMPSDKEVLMVFARAQLAARVTDPMELEMLSWCARWRPEALDYYLPQGWCFGAFSGLEIRGFLIAQPLLFYRGLTQTLWIEHGEFTAAAVAHQLLECVYRWARDKHFQCVLGESSAILQEAIRDWKPAEVHDARLIEIKSSRY